MKSSGKTVSLCFSNYTFLRGKIFFQAQCILSSIKSQNQLLASKFLNGNDGHHTSVRQQQKYVETILFLSPQAQVRQMEHTHIC